MTCLTQTYLARLGPLGARRVVCVLVALWGLGLGHLGAATVNFHDVPGNALLQADGVTALDDSFRFELGTFKASFIPTAHNIQDWVLNWEPFSRAEAPAFNGWNSSVSYFDKDAELLPDGTSNQGLSSDVFAAGDAVYLWIYDVMTLNSAFEWALITNDSSDSNVANNWVMPDPSETFSTDFTLASASKAIWGGVNNVQGAGDFAAPLTIFHLQTHTVPEPTGVVLLLSAAGCAVMRRKR